MSGPPAGGVPVPRIVRCPSCGGRSVYAESNPNRPFCSPRCRNNDLGAWSSEGYRVASDLRPDDADGVAPDLVPPSRR